MRIPDEICRRARGIAILFIVLHNFLHLIPDRFVSENEMSFSIDSPVRILEHICSLKLDMIGDVFSFFGWYGVAVFVFLSGYGLSIKYESQVGPTSYQWTRHFARSIIKLVLLVLPPYLLYVVVVGIFGHPPLVQHSEGVPVIANLCYPFQYPDPGVYWYVGLAIELYALYGLFFCFRSRVFSSLAIVLSLAVMVLVDPLCVGSEAPLTFCRANFVAWLPLFVIGILWARHKPVSTRPPTTAELVGGVVVSIVSLFVFSFEYHLWLLSMFPAVAIVLLLSALSTRIPKTAMNGFMDWLGKHSASVFVVHPLVRYGFLFFLPITGNSVWLWTLSGVFASLLLACGYSIIRRSLSHAAL